MGDVLGGSRAGHPPATAVGDPVLRPPPGRPRSRLRGAARGPAQGSRPPAGPVSVLTTGDPGAHRGGGDAARTTASRDLPGPDQPAGRHRLLLCGSDRNKWDVLTDHPGRAMINYSPPPREVSHMWRVRDSQASEQQRQRAPHPRRRVAKGPPQGIWRNVMQQAGDPWRRPADQRSPHPGPRRRRPGRRRPARHREVRQGPPGPAAPGHDEHARALCRPPRHDQRASCSTWKPAGATATRNARLTAIHSLFRCAAPRALEHAALIARVLAIPAKRAMKTPVNFLTREELEALLAAPERGTWHGRRDHALILLAAQTGLRVSELATLTIDDIHLSADPHVQCTGKGRKQRCTPLTAQTAGHLARWLAERRGASHDPVFCTQAGCTVVPRRRRPAARPVCRHRRPAPPVPSRQDRDPPHTAAILLGALFYFRDRRTPSRHRDQHAARL